MCWQDVWKTKSLIVIASTCSKMHKEANCNVQYVNKFLVPEKNSCSMMIMRSVVPKLTDHSHLSKSFACLRLLYHMLKP